MKVLKTFKSFERLVFKRLVIYYMRTTQKNRMIRELVRTIFHTITSVNRNFIVSWRKFVVDSCSIEDKYFFKKVALLHAFKSSKSSWSNITYIFLSIDFFKKIFTCIILTTYFKKVYKEDEVSVSTTYFKEVYKEDEVLVYTFLCCI